MKNILTYEGIKFSKGSLTNVNDPLAIEMPLEISINGNPFTVVMQTPGNELELAVGLLYAEDVISTHTPFSVETEIGKNKSAEKLNFRIPENKLRKGFLNSRSLLSVSSCGICGKQSLDQINYAEKKLDAANRISVTSIEKMQQTMFQHQTLFEKTGGSHGIAAFNLSGELLSVKEDVGRHNALDKVVGELILNKKLGQAKILTCSGRISFEIVSKAFRAKIPIIVAVSATTSLAVDFAKEYGMTLLAFSRKNKFTCYANDWRLQ